MNTSKQSLDELLNRLQARDFYDAIQAIEKLGASDDLTAAVNAVGELMRKYGNHVRTREETETAIVEAVAGIIGKDDRDYSGDNTDEQSKMILVATATACNELRAEQRQALRNLFGISKQGEKK